MTVRNLRHLFRPKSVALIGASERQKSVGSVMAANLVQGAFEGEVYLVNPKYTRLLGRPVYPDVAHLPGPPDLAVIATPPEIVPSLIAELGERGTKAAVVITAGFAELGAKGRELQQAMLEAARPHLLRIVGPNCLGIVVPDVHLNASFGSVAPPKGRIAFVAQSGAVVAAIVDWATSRGIGFSHLVSLGDMADVDFGDMLDYLADDSGTRAILLYVEMVTQARKFMSAARAAARMKPLIVVKAGRHEEGARAAASHTGALAGSDAVYDAAFRRAGMLRVLTLEELFDAVETLAAIDLPRGDRLAIVTNGGGLGVLATDDLVDRGGHLAELSNAAIERLDAVLPPTWSRSNPIDLIGDATSDRYARALEVLCAERDVDGILVLNCPTAIAPGKDAAQAVADVMRGRRQPTLITSFVGGASTHEARAIFAKERIATFETPTQAIRAFMHLCQYRRNQESLMETPPSIPEEFSPDVERARAVLEGALSEGRAWLTEPEAKDVLAAYQIPMAPSRVGRTPREAAALAAELGGSVALKILSRDIVHKSDVGGVELDLPGPASVEQAASAMLERVRAAQPDARIDGFTVQPMVRRPDAHELIVGLSEDPLFGPTILFGQGGTSVEVVGDTSLALPPLNLRLARELMERTRVFELLRGFRGFAAANLEAIELVLLKVSQLAVDQETVAELDINPLLADAYGVVALDARIRVERRERSGRERLAIRPYPKELEETVELEGGQRFLVRPVMPEDEPSLHAAFAKLSPEEIRLRFFVSMRALSHVMAARFTQLDYDREMALVATEPGIPGRTEIFGVVHLISDPDQERAEYAILVRSDVAGRGLGTLLMRRIIAYAKVRGIGEVFGDVLRENRRMLSICESLGFELSPVDADIVRVRLRTGES